MNRELAIKLLTVPQAAEALGVKSSTIRAWLLRRRLEFVRCGRAIRISSEVIERFIEENTVPAKSK